MHIFGGGWGITPPISWCSVRAINRGVSPRSEHMTQARPVKLFQELTPEQSDEPDLRLLERSHCSDCVLEETPRIPAIEKGPPRTF